jgi:conjugative transfer pilus assembly protein TraH
MIRFFLIAFLTISIYVQAAREYTVPERIFKMTGMETNFTSGDLLYESQAAGYYTGGGGMVVRSPVTSTQLVSAHLPEIQAGCGGIDIYTGGFSFIKGKQLVEALQGITSNAAGFAFMLGLESVSPNASNTMRQLQSWANTINGIGMNSCETAAQLVGSVWPASDMASQHICRAVGTGGTKKFFDDYIEARHQCSTKVNQNNEQIKKYQVLTGEYNIAWEALMALPFFKDAKNLGLAEMYMTLVGTFIVSEQDVKFYFSKAEDHQFLTNLLDGGTVIKYKCQDDKNNKCLTIKETAEVLSKDDSWFSRIRSTIASMASKTINDESLDASEKGLLSTTRLPLYKIINVLSAYHRGNSFSAEMDGIADIVTWDVLSQIIYEALDSVTRGCQQLRANSMYSAEIDQYLEDLERVKKIVSRYDRKIQKAMDLEMRLLQKLQLLEKQINSEIMVY